MKQTWLISMTFDLDSPEAQITNIGIVDNFEKAKEWCENDLRQWLTINEKNYSTYVWKFLENENLLTYESEKFFTGYKLEQIRDLNETIT